MDPVTYDVRYIGMTTNFPARPKSHFKASGNDYKSHWIQSLRSVELVPIVVVLEHGEFSAEQLRAQEVAWIAYGHSMQWPLTNKTAGGDGLIDPDDETRARISVNNKRTWSDPELRKRHSERQKQTYAEHRETYAAGLRRRFSDPNVSVQLREAMENLSDEARERWQQGCSNGGSKAGKARWQCTECEYVNNGRNVSAHHKRVGHTGKTQVSDDTPTSATVARAARLPRSRSEAMALWWSDPENKKRMSATHVARGDVASKAMVAAMRAKIVSCEACEFIGNAVQVSNHQRYNGHVGRVTISATSHLKQGASL